MKDIVEFIKEQKNVIHGEKCDKKIIENYEEELSLKFSSDYKDYLENYTILAIAGHEITGISKSNRVDVKATTIKEKDRNRNISNEMYVIEKANIDDIIIWQNAKGEIFKTIGNSEPKKIENALIDYLKKNIKK